MSITPYLSNTTTVSESVKAQQAPCLSYLMVLGALNKAVACHCILLLQGGWDLNTWEHIDGYSFSLGTQTFIKNEMKLLSNLNLVSLTINKRHTAGHQIMQMHEHFEAKKSSTNPETKCSKNPIQCSVVLPGSSSSFSNLPIPQHHLLFIQKLLNSLGSIPGSP